jgi:hypothetical protein
MSATLVRGKTVVQWDEEWAPVEGGYNVPHPDLRYLLGLHRAFLDGKIVFIGQVTETPGGFAKRLADFRRGNSSGRNSGSGKLIFDNRLQLKLDIIVLGSDKHAVAETKLLKRLMIARHKPVWNHRRAQLIKVQKSGMIVDQIP